MKSIHLVISGLVQGVGFRVWLQRQASAESLHGWVRNGENGTVEAVLSGDRAAVKRITKLCQIGPPGARVTEVATNRVQPPGEASFRIIAA